MSQQMAEDITDILFEFTQNGMDKLTRHELQAELLNRGWTSVWDFDNSWRYARRKLQGRHNCSYMYSFPKVGYVANGAAAGTAFEDSADDLHSELKAVDTRLKNDKLIVEATVNAYPVLAGSSEAVRLERTLRNATEDMADLLGLVRTQAAGSTRRKLPHHH
jgi:hypothetical protein